MSNADIKGSIPTLIKNQLSKKQGDVAGRVEEAMKKGGYKWFIWLSITHFLIN